MVSAGAFTQSRWLAGKCWAILAPEEYERYEQLRTYFEALLLSKKFTHLKMDVSELLRESRQELEELHVKGLEKHMLGITSGSIRRIWGERRSTKAGG